MIVIDTTAVASAWAPPSLIIEVAVAFLDYRLRVLLLPLIAVLGPNNDCREGCFIVCFFFFHPFVRPCVLRQWHDEQETRLGQGAGSAGPPGMAVQEEGEHRLPGYQVEEVLVRAEEDVALLVHQPAGQITQRRRSFPLIQESACRCVTERR